MSFGNLDSVHVMSFVGAGKLASLVIDLLRLTHSFFVGNGY